MHRSARTASLLIAAAASIGVGLTVAAPAAAIPSDPVLPSNPFAAHDKALTNVTTKLSDRDIPGNPVRVVTGAFDRFDQRFGGPAT